MSTRLDKFTEDLRLKLTNVESGLNSLKTRMDSKAQQAEGEARSHLQALQSRIVQQQEKVSAARADIKAWLDEKKSITAQKVAEWKAKQDLKELQNRADRAERYAVATIAVVLASIEEAEQATLEAWLARQDAQAGKKAA